MSEARKTTRGRGALLVQTNCPDPETAGIIARTLVTERLAAAANIHPGVASVYRWEGEIVSRAEHAVILKTEARLFDRICARIRDLHPYRTPAVIGHAPTHLSPDYRDWLAANLGPD